MVLLAVLLPVICGIVGLMIDGGLLALSSRHAQSLADGSALTAATQLRLDRSGAAASSAAQTAVTSDTLSASMTATVNIPPTSGVYAGNSKYAEVLLQQPVGMNVIQVLTGRKTESVSVRAVAGVEDSAYGGAIVVLDPSPEQFSLGVLPITLPLSLPSLIGGIEVLGLGKVTVNGAVQVNTQWGGYDADFEKAGIAAGPPYAVATTPLLPLTKLYTPELRTVGGVDNPTNYLNTISGQGSPIQANALAVTDPLITLPAPTTNTDAANVKATNYGGKTIISLPILPPVVLNPGVYDYINVVSGNVVFNPGIYIIRGTNPGLPALNLVAGTITANGVMFYLTESTYSVTSGAPDASDGSTEPAAPTTTTLLPSAIVNVGLLGSSYTPLSSAGSPFNGMMFYQRRGDRRPLIIVQESLLLGGTLQGTVYAKWGHVLLAGIGTYDARFVAGTMRLVAIADLKISPTTLFPAAKDVYLVE